MRKIVLTFGLISGAILSAMMVLTLPLQDRLGHGSAALVVGYATMVAASLLIYFGVRRYRDEVGSVSFGRALAVGVLIACVAGACYTATWEVIYFNFMPDFMEKYQATQLENEAAKGATPAQLEKHRAELQHYAELYKNPVVNVAMTFLEPLPVGLGVALISAGLLRRRRNPGGASELASLA